MLSILSNLLPAIVVALAIGVILQLRRKESNTFILSGLVITLAVWVITYLLSMVPAIQMSTDVFKAINYLCLASAGTFQLYFALDYANRSRWLTPFTILIFLIGPVMVQAFFWSEYLREVFFYPEVEALDRFNLLYTLLLLAGSVIFLVDTFATKPRKLFSQAGIIVLGALFPIVGTIALFFVKDLETGIFISVFSYSLAVTGFSYEKFNNNLTAAIPLTREIVVEGMDDGWMVIDQNDKVIDMNSAAEKMIGMSRERIYGQAVDLILNEWPRLSRSPDGIKEMEMRRSVKAHNDWRYLNIRISQLMDKNNEGFGHLIVWRDITSRKLADDARQRARDELFVLLNAISSMASRSMNMDEFLSESIYQILYSFNSQAVAVFLTSEEEKGNKQKLLLQSHFGFPPEQFKVIKSDSAATSINQWLSANEENRPLVIDAFGEPVEALSYSLKNIGFSNAVLVPMIVYTQHENALLGCLYLGRNDNSAYTQDEIIRLTTIANQISTLIDSTRRRQFAIALTERQRLLRDLHDSVSQKLYGLVALTEAAQAGIEAGSQIAPLQVLTRIGENARQAVKEMRLFLYEMQPVDLKDGLVSSLHHRLAAVEGRADIKAGLVADENIQLSKDTEIAIYYIAQEALNNILRHAHARNVSVILKQTRQNVTLEIIDDGIGFAMKKIDNAGLGLKNMRERAVQANGKIRIISKVNKGTKISVTVSRKG
jgi:PAS domain S-box-containing protein